MKGLSWSQALAILKTGGRAARAGWNGKGMFVFLIHSWTYKHDSVPTMSTYPFVALKTVQGDVVPWTCAQPDALAEDWETVE